MSSFTTYLLDGYALNNTNNYSFTTQWVSVRDALTVGCSVNFISGSPSGTLSIQGSCEPPIGVFGATQNVSPGVTTFGEQPQFNGADATALTLDSAGDTTVTISTSGTNLFSFALPGWRWMRVLYVATSGTSSVNILVHAKW